MLECNYTNLEISQRLSELGFEAETDAWWCINTDITELVFVENYDEDFVVQTGGSIDRYPAYSAQTLLDVLPKKIEGHFLTMIKHENNSSTVGYLEQDWSPMGKNLSADTLANALGMMVIELINKGIKLNV